MRYEWVFFRSRACVLSVMPTEKSSRPLSAVRKASSHGSRPTPRRRNPRRGGSQSKADIELVAKFAEVLGSTKGRRKSRKRRAGLSQAIDRIHVPGPGALDVMPGARLTDTGDLDDVPAAPCLAVHRRHRIQGIWRGAASWCLTLAVIVTFVGGMGLVVLSQVPGSDRAIVKTASAQPM